MYKLAALVVGYVVALRELGGAQGTGSSCSLSCWSLDNHAVQFRRAKCNRRCHTPLNTGANRYREGANSRALGLDLLVGGMQGSTWSQSWLVA